MARQLKQQQERKPLKSKIGKIINLHNVWFMALGTLSIVALLVTGTIAGRLYEASYPIVLVISILIPFALFLIIDKYFFPNFDTIDELKRNNIAVALYVLSYAIIAVAAILSAGGFLAGGVP